MEEEIINICKKIRNISKCSACGGSYKLDTCKYCGTKNNELSELISILNSLINSFRSQINISNINSVNNLFNYLYMLIIINTHIVSNKFSTSTITNWILHIRI